MKTHTKVILIGGYVITAGVVMSVVGYIPVETIGNVFCGIGIALLARGIEMFIRHDTDQ